MMKKSNILQPLVKKRQPKANSLASSSTTKDRQHGPVEELKQRPEPLHDAAEVSRPSASALKTMTAVMKLSRPPAFHERCRSGGAAGSAANRAPAARSRLLPAGIQFPDPGLRGAGPATDSQPGSPLRPACGGKDRSTACLFRGGRRRINPDAASRTATLSRLAGRVHSRVMRICGEIPGYGTTWQAHPDSCRTPRPPMTFTRRFILAAALAAPVVSVATFYAASPATAAKPEIFAPGGKAIRGTDPVAYFTQGKPVAGSPDYTYEWKGATWYFASAANRDRFKAESGTLGAAIRRLLRLRGGPGLCRQDRGRPMVGRRWQALSQLFAQRAADLEAGYPRLYPGSEQELAGSAEVVRARTPRYGPPGLLRMRPLDTALRAYSG